MFVMLMHTNASLCGLFCHRPPANSPGNVRRRSEFSLISFYFPSKNGQCWENDYQGTGRSGRLFTFLKGECQILPLTGRKFQAMSWKKCRCSNSAFLHGVEWDRLIMHQSWTSQICLLTLFSKIKTIDAQRLAIVPQKHYNVCHIILVQCNVEPQNAPYTICSLEVHIVYPAYTICSPLNREHIV